MSSESTSVVAKAKMKSVVLIPSLLALVFRGTDGLECYECTHRTDNARYPHSDPNCFSNWSKVPRNNCTSEEKYCQIIILKLGSTKAIERSCASEALMGNITTEINGVTTSYSWCQQDGCNAAPALSSGVRTIIPLFLAVFGCFKMLV